MTASSETHTTLIQALLRPQAWPAVVGQVEHIETHISTVLLAGDYAYKIKKPVDLGFLDFSTLERRRHFCEEELRLNGRLAPHIYLAVVPITGTAQQPCLGGEGPAIEYAVKMRRFPADALLSLHPEAITEQQIDAIADQVAAFHARIAVYAGDEDYGTPPAVLAPMQENFEQIRALVDEPETLGELGRLEAWTLHCHRALSQTLAARRAAGCIRECHGDMHLGNIAWVAGEPLIFDGIEFNPYLRWIDTLNEIAFLVMDLEEKRRSDLARRFLNRYLKLTGDYVGLMLLRFYQLYRAMVRAKVAAIRLGQADLEAADKAAVMAEFRAYLELAEGYTRPARPALIINHGASGSGKSYGTGPVIQDLGAIRVRSDVERQRLARLEGWGRSGAGGIDQGIYTRSASDRTYARLLELAESILEAGFVAIVDATFLQVHRREPFYALAQKLKVPFVILDFEAPEALLRARIEQRLAEGADPSEANLEVLAAQLAKREPLSEEERRHAIQVTAERPLDIAVLRRRLDLA